MTVLETKEYHTPTAQAETRWSYTSGTSDTPLLGLTIGHGESSRNVYLERIDDYGCVRQRRTPS